MQACRGGSTAPRRAVGAAVGIAPAPAPGAASDELIRNVDLALCAGDEKIVAFEALLRRNRPKRGRISRAGLVPNAADAGLIDRIGRSALRKACEDLARWPRDPLRGQPPHPAICQTRSAHHLCQGPGAQRACPLAARAGNHPERVARRLRRHRCDLQGVEAGGVRLALHDFGTCHCSLSFLKKALYDKIKIDRSFVERATEEGSRNGTIIASITSLAEAPHMDTAAEGGARRARTGAPARLQQC